jgi:XTP/dITP diphosphohydrolase
MIKLLIATGNLHKVREITSILGAGCRYSSLRDYPGAPSIVEDAPTFAGNAAKKAVELARWFASARDQKDVSEVFVLDDDSGLEVDALNGAPGVHSARFAALDSGEAGNSATTENNAKLLRLLKEVPEARRTARFRCVLALTPVFKPEDPVASPVCYADEFETRTELFEGACEGKIMATPRGFGGFGYDPLFVPDGYEQTFGELGEEIKNKLSHRARALEKLRGRLFG